MSSVILEEKKVAFVHIPKCAGFSISETISANDGAAKRRPARNLDKPMSAVQYITGIRPNIWSKFYSFCFIRNPWDWTVSGWIHVAKNVNCYTKAPTFEQFLDGAWNENLGENPWPRKYQSTEVGVAAHTQITQWEHLSLKNGQLAPFHFFGRFESLEKDWKRVCRVMNISDKLRHKNKSKRLHYRHYYNDRTRQIVAKRNQYFIDFFGYRY